MQPVVLVGNPNVGKSALFNALTGRYATVSNYPGTTVDVTRGKARLGGLRRALYDTPGANGLQAASEDERVTRDILLDEPHAAIQVADAKNLRRALAFTIQLGELGVRTVLALNMSDEAAARGLRIDRAALEERAGVPVVPTVATEGHGVRDLDAAVERARVPGIAAAYPPAVEAAVEELEGLLGRELTGRRGLALMLLSGDREVRERLRGWLGAAGVARAEALARELERRFGSLAAVLDGRRLRAADDAVAQVVRGGGSRSGDTARRIGELSLHPIWGVPILAAVLLVAYLFVGRFGAGTAVGFFEERVFGAWLLPAFRRLLDAVLPAGPVAEFLAGSRGLLVGQYGLVSMALTYAFSIILPIVTTFFIAFAVLEDSGYLPRLAALLNRVMSAIGLNGKAVLPLVLGLGCDTMATMTARILESRKQRVLVTLLLALAVPCSAQLSLILAMMAGVSAAGFAVWLGVVLGVLFLVGFIAARVLPGRPGEDEFLMELPPMRVPGARNVLVKTFARVEWYLREAVPLFLLGTALLWTLDRLGGLALLERAGAPLVQGVLGLPAQATSAFLLGFLRRDFGAAGLFALYRPWLAGGAPAAVEIQMVTAMVTTTLFIPCIANLMMMIKERGWRTGLAIAGFILPFAFAVGGAVRVVLTWVWL
jgi:ferrous iron transport protein B